MFWKKTLNSSVVIHLWLCMAAKDDVQKDVQAGSGLGD